MLSRILSRKQRKLIAKVEAFGSLLDSGLLEVIRHGQISGACQKEAGRGRLFVFDGIDLKLVSA